MAKIFHLRKGIDMGYFINLQSSPTKFPYPPPQDRQVRAEERGEKSEKEETVEERNMRVPAPIKVIGVGGGGCNAVRRMMKKPTPGVAYIVCNTDIKSLDSCPTEVLSVQIGEHLTRGFGAGGDMRVGEKAAEEGRFLKDAELVFVTAGMGGGTGTGAAPVVADIARESRALVIGVVTTPFSFEGKRRFQLALTGIRRLRPSVDNLIIIHNDRLLQYCESNSPTQTAFGVADEAIAEGILAVSQLVNVPGEINVDLADVKTVMGIPGGALMAIGRSEGGRYPAQEAAEQAIANPLLDIDIKGAKGILFNFTGGPDLTLGEVNDAANTIAREVDPSAIMFFGMSTPDEDMRNKVKLTLVATGINPPLPSSWLAEMGETIKEVLTGHRRPSGYR
jgi:cell division protein FtsZ